MNFFKTHYDIMLINELSKRTGVSIHTLRYYETLGLIKGERDESVSSNNYKHYDEVVVQKVDWIIEAKKVAFTLAEIKVFVQDWFDNELTVAEKVAIGDKKIEEVELKIKQLEEVRTFLLQAKKDVEDKLC